MGKQWMAAAGYLSIFLVPALFLTGSAIGRPWLAFGAVIVVFPMARVVFGAHDLKSGVCGSVVDLFGESRLNHHVLVTGGVRARGHRSAVR
mgnify:CR=1 FL=1